MNNKKINFNNKSMNFNSRKIESAALKAAAKSVVENKTARVQNPSTAKNSRRRTTDIIDREITSLYNLISSKAGEGTIVVKEKVPAGMACRGKVSVYNIADLQRQEAESAEFKHRLALGYSRNELPKPFKAVPAVSYAFYPSATDGTKLGSVAIYGGGAEARAMSIAAIGHLFGHIVKAVSVEWGVRQFVDVKFVA